MIFLTEFYQSEIDQTNIDLNQAKIEKDLIEKFKMQGRVEQLEDMLKRDVAKEISDEIITQLHDKIDELSNKLDLISQKGDEDE